MLEEQGKATINVNKELDLDLYDTEIHEGWHTVQKVFDEYNVELNDEGLYEVREHKKYENKLYEQEAWDLGRKGRQQYEKKKYDKK